jgi:hypothetical protein
MDRMRRSVIGAMGMAAMGAMAGVARADRIRILPGEPTPDAPSGPGQTVPVFQRFVSAIRIGPARAHRGLQVFWLYGPEADVPLDIATLEEARAGGRLVITEEERASVPTLVIDNRGKSHVLLLAGEILIGGKQNRVLREDILLPPLSGPRNIGVYCVEQGRWDQGRKAFEARGSFAAPGLRSHLLDRTDQQRVWAEVERYAARAQAPSPTGSYQAVYDKTEVKEHLDSVERGLDHRAAPGALGAAVFAGERLAGLDCFCDPGLFAREWPKLLRAQALEVYREPSAAPGEALLRVRVEELLAWASTVSGLLRANAGVGRVFEFRAERTRGSALVFAGRVPHVAVL